MTQSSIFLGQNRSQPASTIGNFPANKRIALMELCGNRAPAQYEAMRLNCELVDLSKDQQIKALEQQIQMLRAA